MWGRLPTCGGLLTRLPACLPTLLLSLSLHAQTPLEFQETRYEPRLGQPAKISASRETLDFLRTAKTRRVEISGAPAEGFVVAPNRSGEMVIAASSKVAPGEYHVTVTAAGETGQERRADLTVAVQPRLTVPSGASRPPVVLLNGWEIGFTDTCPVAGNTSDDFGNLAQYLVSDGVPVVYLFDNCAEGPGQTVETLGNDLATLLNTIKYDTGAQVPQIDLVAFSLGGLIARSYLAGLQSNGSLTPPSTTLIHKMVLIATPNFGSYLTESIALNIPTGSQASELIPGSALQWNLANWNQRTDDLHGVSAIAIAGNAALYSVTSPTLGTQQLNNAGDGVVSLTSASIGFVQETASQTRIVPYCHVDPSVFTNTAFGSYLCNAAGIVNITSASHPTSQIVRSFLAGTSDWQSIGSIPTSDPYLSVNGSMLFALVNGANAYASDLSSVTWGSVSLNNGGDLNTIYFGDFLQGTGVLQPVSASIGTVNCGSYAVAYGYGSAVRCKIGAAIFSVGPLLTTFPKVVSTGAITIAGNNFNGLCMGCKVTATPAGSTTAQTLTVNSWTNTSINATLPSTLTGLVTLTVYALTGTDSMAILAGAPNPSTISLSPSSLQFAYTVGGSIPNTQSIQISNSGSGTLAWTATSNQPWLTISPSSGTATSTITVTVSPTGLTPGSYTGAIQISASGASNTPQSVPVSFTVTVPAPVLSVSPATLTFSYAIGGTPPAAQTVAIANTGGGTLPWSASDADYWVALLPASANDAGTLTVTLNPVNLPAGTYTSTVQINASGAGGSAVTITLQVTGTLPLPNITGAGNAASFLPGFASATWISIFGQNLSASTYTWQTSDFVNGNLPASLQGVAVSINGVAAYVEYISPNQINVLAPDDAATGPVNIQVTTGGQASNTASIPKNVLAPGFFTVLGRYAAAQHADYTLVGAANLISGVTSTPAKPGETILIYATGFGPTNPPVPTGQLVSTPEPLASSVNVSIGGSPATVVFAGLIAPGLYQLNVTVPNLPAGDAAITASIGAATTQSGVSITVGQ